MRMAFHAIKAGEGDQYIAAGVEAVSRAGLGAGMPDETKHPQLDGSEGSLYDVYIPMGLTAENVAERCKVCREAQDEWAVTPRTARSTPRSPATSTGDRPRRHAAPTSDKAGNEVDVPRRRDQGRRPAAGHDAWRCSQR